VWKTPIVAYGPGDSTLDHTAEEHILISEYQKAIEVLAEVLSTL
jgi:LysW-gamma-L-lysine carboxypeptidase